MAGSSRDESGPMMSLPLVALLGNRDCSVESTILEDVATVDCCDAKSSSEKWKKVFDEAVGVCLWHTFTLSKEYLQKFKRLNIIVCIGWSVDNVDLKASGQMGIAVCNVPGYGVEEVADTALCLILHLYRRSHWLAHKAQQKRKLTELNKQMWEITQGKVRVKTSTLGIVGMGRIGLAVASRAKTFGFNVIVYDPYVPHGREHGLGLKRVHVFKDLLTQVDCLSLHCSLNERNHNLINEVTVNLMRPGAFLVNTASAALVKSNALALALKKRHLLAAAIDLHRSEPYNIFPVTLKEAPNLVCTPHPGFFNIDSDAGLRKNAALEIKKSIKGCLIPESLIHCRNADYLPGPIANPKVGLAYFQASIKGLLLGHAGRRSEQARNEKRASVPAPMEVPVKQAHVTTPHGAPRTVASNTAPSTARPQSHIVPVFPPNALPMSTPDPTNDHAWNLTTGKF